MTITAAFLLEGQSTIVTLVPVTLLLILLFLTMLYTSKTVIRYLATPIAYLLLRWQWSVRGRQNKELNKLLNSRAEIRNCAIWSQTLKWQHVTNLRKAVRCLRKNVLELDVPETDRSLRTTRAQLADDLSEWEDIINRIKNELPQENLAGSPSQKEFRSEFEQSMPDQLDSRLKQLVSWHLYHQNVDCTKEYVYDALVIMSGLTIVLAIITIFELLPSTATAYQATFGVLVAAVLSYYLSEGFERGNGA